MGGFMEQRKQLPPLRKLPQTGWILGSPRQTNNGTAEVVFLGHGKARRQTGHLGCWVFASKSWTAKATNMSRRYLGKQAKTWPARESVRSIPAHGTLPDDLGSSARVLLSIAASRRSLA